jgi:hypothetical protein
MVEHGASITSTILDKFLLTMELYVKGGVGGGGIIESVASLHKFSNHSPLIFNLDEKKG